LPLKNVLIGLFSLTFKDFWLGIISGFAGQIKLKRSKNCGNIFCAIAAWFIFLHNQKQGLPSVKVRELKRALQNGVILGYSFFAK
jgi:hypothetical protein